MDNVFMISSSLITPHHLMANDFFSSCVNCWPWVEFRVTASRSSSASVCVSVTNTSIVSFFAVWYAFQRWYPSIKILSWLISIGGNLSIFSAYSCIFVGDGLRRGYKSSRQIISATCLVSILISYNFYIIKQIDPLID